ncbi:MAG TPA: hypothetical protein PK011_11600 [Marinagarivorans sp.]|nr:hypothetical protein [Marinagarivorans sp.]HNG60170.1 hypothetical protein [Cellvibrionaceae bacterium]
MLRLIHCHKNKQPMRPVSSLVVSVLFAATLLASLPSFALEADECKHLDWSVDDLAKFKQSQFPSDFYQPFAGKTIRHVRIETGPVFDRTNPKENNWLYRSLDALHINTKPQVIASQLLFRAGELLDEDKVLESARILRTRGYLASAYILPEAVCGDAVDLVVMTRDVWSTEPDTSLSRNGGENKSGFGISEGNLLGYGNELAIGYETVAERSAINYDFTSPHIFNSHYYAHLSYADKTDGKDKIVELAKPFYSLQTPYAYGVTSKTITEAEILRYGGVKRSAFLHSQERYEIFAGHALVVSDAATTRLIGGVAMDEDEYAATAATRTPLPADEVNRYPWLAVRKIENHFGAFKNLQQIQRVEDVLLGSDLYVRLGYAAENFRNERDGLLMQAYYSDVLASGDNHLLQFKSSIALKDYAGSAERFALTQHLTYNHFLSDHSRWYVDAQWDYGKRLLPQDEFTLGGASGLRGYPLEFQRGQERYLLTTEYRYFSDWHLFNLLRVGGVVFAETGKAWNSQIQTGQETLSDVGFGLRISSSKARVGSVVHIDIAMPTASREGIDSYQLVVSTLQTF